MRDYSKTEMLGITEPEYETLFVHLAEQLTAVCVANGHGEESHNAAADALTNTWQAALTANGWLQAAGKRLDVDVSGCVGA